MNSFIGAQSNNGALVINPDNLPSPATWLNLLSPYNTGQAGITVTTIPSSIVILSRIPSTGSRRIPTVLKTYPNAGMGISATPGGIQNQSFDTKSHKCSATQFFYMLIMWVLLKLFLVALNVY